MYNLATVFQFRQKDDLMNIHIVLKHCGWPYQSKIPGSGPDIGMVTSNKGVKTIQLSIPTLATAG